MSSGPHEPEIRIGYTLSLTGPVEGNSRSAQLSHQIWQDQINATGGFLGRPVRLVCYDDQADAALTEQLYRRLIDDEKVDLVIGGYGTANIVAAMPVIIERQRYFVGLQGLGANNDFQYARYFAMIPTGTDPNAALTEGFFAVAAEQTPRPRTVALLSADAEFSLNPILGAKANAAKYGFDIVHEARYPLSTTNFRPYLDAVAETNCDLLFLCSYLADTVGVVRAVHSHPFCPKMVGGAMIGPQNADVKVELGPALNGVVNYEYWVPGPVMDFPGVAGLMDAYQGQAVERGVDPLGHYMAPTAYAQLQVLAQAVRGTGSLDDATLTEYTRASSFDTVLGEVRFGTNGEWVEPRVLQVQFQGIDGHDIEQFRDGSRQVVIAPSQYAQHGFVYPYADVIA